MRCSVVICTYNYAHFLPDALQTLAAQTSPDFELVIVDDGSTDHTAEVVGRSSQRFQNCVYLKKAHTGLADSRNVGVRKASGTHIAFLDADDLWSPHCLAALRGVFEENRQAEVVCCDGLRMLASGVVRGTLFPAGLPPVCGPITSAKDLFSFFPNVAPSALMFARSAYERVGPFQGWSLTTGEDWDWIIRAAYKNTLFVRLDRQLVVYRFHGANLVSHADKMFEAWLSIYSETLKPLAKDPQVAVLARRFTRRRLLSLVPQYPWSQGQRLLRLSAEAFGGDRLLETAHFAGYLGLLHLIKLARFAVLPFRRSRRLMREHRNDPPASVSDMLAKLPTAHANA